MEWNNKIPEWKNTGTEPSDDRKQKGFESGYKPPAGIFNWFWSLVSKAITELQTIVSNLVSHAANKENPHGVTAKQLGLDKVDNTPDSQKSVNFASEAGVGRKVKNSLTVRFKGGSTEGTDLWTYDGSTGKSINITPDKIGASKADHTHTLDGISETSEKKMGRIVAAHSDDGVSYTATVDGITELYNGLEITIIPDTRSTTTAISLNVNGLGAVSMRRPLSFSTFVATAPDRDYFLYENTPCRLMYHANYANGGIWLMADKVKTSAQDLYGSVPIENGGTGANTVEGALENLGLTGFGKVQSGSYEGNGTYGSNNPNSLTFDFVPKIVFVSHKSSSQYQAFFINGMSSFGIPYNLSTPNGGHSVMAYERVNLTWSDKTVSWYSAEDEAWQLNLEGITYYYVAIG